jgi:excisionase family DNA binding protein
MVGIGQNDIEGTSWDTMGRGGTLWDTFGEINSLTSATNMEIKKRCKYCGRSFIAHKMTTLYCSPSCNNKDYKRNIRQKQIAEFMEGQKKNVPPVDNLGNKAFLTPTEGAQLLGISRATFYRYMRDGIIKAVQLRGKTIVRRKDIENLFDHPASYQPHSDKKQKKREYYTIRQISEKFKVTKKAILHRCEKYNIKKVYQGRNCFFDRSQVDVHFAELIAEFDLRDYYTIQQLEEKYMMSHNAVLSFVQRNKIPRITQGKTVYYSRAHIDTLKGERESVDPNYYTYAEIMEKYHFSKDQVSYYIHNYEIDSHKQGRFTVVNRKEFDRIIKERMQTNSLAKEQERKAKQPKINTIPEGYITVAQIAEKYGVTPKHVQAKTREAKTPKITIKHFNYYNEAAIEQLFNKDPEKFEVPEDYITAQEIARRYKVTVHHVHGRTREAKVPKITIKNINFYELKTVEALFSKNLPKVQPNENEAEEWITGEQIEDMMGISISARRTFVSRHKIPSKKEYGITYYLRSAIEETNNVMAKYGDLYFTVEQICEKFKMSRDKVYGMLRYSNVRKIHEGKYALFLKEDIIKIIYERQSS